MAVTLPAAVAGALLGWPTPAFPRARRASFLSTSPLSSFVRMGRPLSDVSYRASPPVPAAPTASEEESVKLTYLEINSWIWEVNGLRLLVDPVLVGNLDFGVPWLYDAAKKTLRNYQLTDLPDLDFLLITQSLDDHCHVRTLRQLSQRMPDLPVIATPNAESILSTLFKNVTYLEPGTNTEIRGKNGAKTSILATVGPVLGPPWQRPENGYLVNSGGDCLSFYYEPHCVYDQSFLEKYRADIVITPVIKQLLPAFTLVSGQEDAVRLAKLLGAKYVVPMNNGDNDAKGMLSSVVKCDGSVESFKALLSRELPSSVVLEPIPGVPLEISRSRQPASS